jgi:hypothetical protein
VGLSEELARYPLLDALRGRRSRRFGLGMEIGEGPLAWKSRSAPVPLTEEEEAALAFAACGVTGSALADLAYGPGQGGRMLAGLLGRTVASADAVHTVAVAVINDEATYLLKRPQDFPPAEIPELIRLAAAGELVELYRRSRVRLCDGRVAPPLEPFYNFNINRWSLYAPGTTYFLPINELTALYINVLLEVFDEEMGGFLLDERAGLRPAGIARFARGKGGHLDDDPAAGRTGTVGILEASLMESAAVEQGMVLQNLGLMAQALGLCGFPNYARHEYGWFHALGFRMGTLPTTRYLGMSRWISLAARLLRRDRPVPYPLGLETEGISLRPYCPPSYPTMEAAVHAFVETKFGPEGTFRGGAASSAWRDPQGTAAGIAAPGEKAVAATAAYCEYLYRRYGRFPAYSAPFRTVIGYQVCHGDPEFYDRFYRPEALTEAQRGHGEHRDVEGG